MRFQCEHRISGVAGGGCEYAKTQDFISNLTQRIKEATMRLLVREVGRVSDCSWKSVALGASLVVLSAGWALAAPAIVLDYLNLRAGPGYNYAVIEIIPAGWMVEAGGCADGW